MSRTWNQPEELEVVEKKKIKRITFNYYVSSVLNAFSLERGGIYTLKRIFVNPGKMVRDYLASERFSLTPPFRLLLISTTLVVLVLNYSKSGNEFATGLTHEMPDEKFLEILDFVHTFLNVFLWLYIPIISLFQWLFNRRSGFNFSENLVLHTYLYTVINVVSLIIAVDHLIDSMFLILLISLISFGYYIYAYKEFLEKSWGRSVLEVSLLLLISAIGYTVLIMLILIGVALVIKL